MIDFWSPLALSWAQNGSQNRPSGTKRLKKKHPGNRKKHPGNRYCCQLASKTVPEAFLGTMLVDFGWINARFWSTLALSWAQNGSTA